MSSSRFELLDLFSTEIAHGKKAAILEEEDEKTEKSKDEKHESSNSDEVTKTFEIDIWDIVKYVGLFVGGGYLIHKLLTPKQGTMDSNQMMLSMMFLIYQSNMQMMSALQRPVVAAGSPAPGETTAAATSHLLSEDNRDWIRFFQENKGKILDRDQEMKLDELGLKENWRVERDLKGNILNVYKVNEYLR